MPVVALLRFFDDRLSGVPGHPIMDIQLNDIYIQHRGGGTSEDATLQPPEAEDKYPEPNMFGRMPAHGVFVRHARNISLNNVEFLSSKEDFRPAFVLEDVQGAEFFRVRTPHVGEVPTFSLNNVDGFSVFRSKHVPDVQFDRATRERF